MYVDFEKVRNWFDSYVRSFDLSVSMIRLKHDHSYDVMNIGEKLTYDLEWNSRDRATGVAACLIHDTGRFSQYRDFGTYYDGASVDHGDRGYQVLSAELPNDAADAGGREALLQSVKWHNKKVLPELPPEVTPFCRLARDSDKLDVFALVERRINEGTVGDLLPRHKIDAPLSPSLLQEVESTWSGSYKNASSLLDFLLIQMTWALDLNYAPALQRLIDSGVLQKIADRFPRGDERVQAMLHGLFERIEEHRKALIGDGLAYKTALSAS